MARPSLDRSVPVLVLKVGNYAVHHGGLGVTRSLGRLGVPVYAVCEDRFAPVGLSRYTTGRFVWRTAGQREHQGQLLAGIADVASRIEHPAVLVATDDHAAMFVAEHSQFLRRWFHLPRQSPERVRQVCDKAWLNDWCHREGVPVPAASVVSNTDELASVAQQTAFPVVAKRSQPWLLADGRRATSTRVVTDRRELERLPTTPSPLLLQEHIPRDCGEDWLFHAYCDTSSECLVAFTGRKVRAFPAGAGETALGRAVGNPYLEQQARALMRKLAYTGPVSLDYRLDRRDGRYKLLDFNPRMGAGFRLFETDSGIDVIRAMHLDLTGRAVAPGRQVDRVLAVEGYEVRSAWSQLHHGLLTLAELWSSWRSVDETAWFAADDIVPAVVALGRSVPGLGGLRARPWKPQAPRYSPGRAAWAARAGAALSR